MSLRDTIEAARREAEKAGNLPARAAKGQGDKVRGQSETGAGEKRGGFSSQADTGGRARGARRQFGQGSLGSAKRVRPVRVGDEPRGAA